MTKKKNHKIDGTVSSTTVQRAKRTHVRTEAIKMWKNGASVREIRNFAFDGFVEQGGCDCNVAGGKAQKVLNDCEKIQR